MDWRVDTWTAIKPPSIYHAVKRLQADGKLAAAGPQSSPHGPARVAYRVTAAGDDEFFVLLQEALTSPEIEEFGTGIAFMHCLPRARVQQLLLQRLEATRAIDQQLEGMKAHWPDPAAPPHGQHLLELWRGTFSSQSAWTANLLRRLDEFDFATTDRDR
jgi:DNA-binding PadR family transcriptional regulator